jgi:hypothetical protein
MVDIQLNAQGKTILAGKSTGAVSSSFWDVMLDGTSNARGGGGVEGDSSTTEKKDTQWITGTRSVLLQRILQSAQLTPVWEEGLSASKSDHPSPVNELLWVICTVTIQVGNE